MIWEDLQDLEDIDLAENRYCGIVKNFAPLLRCVFARKYLNDDPASSRGKFWGDFWDL
jgi:hypothetical protein